MLTVTTMTRKSVGRLMGVRMERQATGVSPVRNILNFNNVVDKFLPTGP